MGCGKSKHSVETANTVVKSTNSDRTTKQTVTGKKDSSVIQKEVETERVFVQDTKKETVTTKIDDTDNVGPTSTENVGKVTEVIKDSNPTDVGPTATAVSAANPDSVVPTPSPDDVGTAEVVKDNEVKTVEVPPTEDGETKESKVIKDKTKTEFMTPTLSEDVLGPFEAVKDDEEVKDSKDENVKISDEKFVKKIDDSKDDSFKVEEQKVVTPSVESTKVETKKEENVEVTKADIANAKTSPVTEQEKVPIAVEANVAETYEKEP